MSVFGTCRASSEEVFGLCIDTFSGPFLCAVPGLNQLEARDLYRAATHRSEAQAKSAIGVSSDLEHRLKVDVAPRAGLGKQLPILDCRRGTVKF